MRSRINDRGTLERRFWAKVQKTETCWIWTAYIDTTGYGRIRQNKIGKMAHRVAYEWLVGPIPEGLVIDHLCENRACVNPGHLEPVTNGINVERELGKRTVCKYGHPLDGWMRNGDRRIRRYCRTCDQGRSRRKRQRRKAQHVV